MKTPASLIVVLVLAGCAAIRIDVDVYKGPLANHEDVQIQQLITLADGAKPLLVTLRDELQFEADIKEFLKDDSFAQPENVSAWRQKQAWYRPDFVFGDQCNISDRIEQLKEAQIETDRQLKEHEAAETVSRRRANEAEENMKVIDRRLDENRLKKGSTERYLLVLKLDTNQRKRRDIENSTLEDSYTVDRLKQLEAEISQLEADERELNKEREIARIALDENRNVYNARMRDLNNASVKYLKEIERLSEKKFTTYAFRRKGRIGGLNNGVADHYACFSDERAFRVNLILGHFFFEDPLYANSNTSYDEAQDPNGVLPDEVNSPGFMPRSGVGLAQITRAYKLCLNRPETKVVNQPQKRDILPCAIERKKYLRERLLRTYVGFAERLLVLANSEALQPRRQPGFFERFSSNPDLQQKIDSYAAFLQSIGNSIQVAADELIQKADFVRNSERRLPSELGAQRSATEKNAIEIIDDVLTDLRIREVKGSKDVLDCWRAKNIDQLRSLNIDQAFYCVAHYATVDKSTRL